MRTSSPPAPCPLPSPSDLLLASSPEASCAQHRGGCGARRGDMFHKYKAATGTNPADDSFKAFRIFQTAAPYVLDLAPASFAQLVA
eukprot:7272844-Alexandrium_andersonii.AAC.1